MDSFGGTADKHYRGALEDPLGQEAYHDLLTGLPDRTLFMEHLCDALRRAESREESMAVMVLDLDTLRLVNHSLGYEAGDHVLLTTAERLRGCLRSEDVIARLGGDEFAILLKNIPEPDEGIRIAERIEEELRTPCTIGELEISITASIGIAFGGVAQDRPEDLLRNADTAMYRAKDKGGVGYEVFDANTEIRALERLKLRSDLLQAIKREELTVRYQPQVLLDTGSIVGMQACVYWKHTEHGLISPSEFVPIAEGSHLILPIGRRLLREPSWQAWEWQEKHNSDTPLMVSMNLFARQFYQPDLVEEVAGLLEETGLSPRSLNFKIAESVAMKDACSTITILSELKSLGTQLTISNFGAGYSSLGYLSRFPLDFLEIDRSFIGRLQEASTDAAIVSGIISLAHALALTVTAEGVETLEQVVQLHRMGCNLAQGTYFSEPLPSEAASALLACGHRYSWGMKQTAVRPTFPPQLGGI